MLQDPKSNQYKWLFRSLFTKHWLLYHNLLRAQYEKLITINNICVSHTAGCGVPDTTPAPENNVAYAQGTKKFYQFSTLLQCLVINTYV